MNNIGLGDASASKNCGLWMMMGKPMVTPGVYSETLSLPQKPNTNSKQELFFGHAMSNYTFTGHVVPYFTCLIFHDIAQTDFISTVVGLGKPM